VYWSVEPFTTVLYTGMTAIGFPELSSVPIDDVVALAEPEVPLLHRAHVVERVLVRDDGVPLNLVRQHDVSRSTIRRCSLRHCRRRAQIRRLRAGRQPTRPRLQPPPLALLAESMFPSI